MIAFTDWLSKKNFLHLGSSVLTNLVALFSITLIHHIISFKTYEYQDEEEWRLYDYINISRLEKGNFPEFFIKNNLLCPYYDVPIDLSRLREIRLGPCCDSLNIDAFLILCKKHQIDTCVEITRSQTPYRG